jgi:hypothetical protein
MSDVTSNDEYCISWVNSGSVGGRILLLSRQRITAMGVYAVKHKRVSRISKII